MIDRRAHEHPDREFLIDPDAGLTLTYARLQRKCRQFAALLSSMDVDADAHVAFMLDNGYWTALVMLGTMYANCVTVPLNVVASVKNLSFAIDNVQPSVVFVGNNYQSLYQGVSGEPHTRPRVVAVDYKTGFDLPGRSDAGSHAARRAGEAPAMILHTSGTVGKPKGAVLSHANLIAGGRNVELGHELRHDDRALCALPLYHINGQVVTVVTQLVTGSSVVMPSRFSTSRFWKYVRKYRCTWISIVPTMGKFLLDAAHRDGEAFDISQLASLRFARSASSAMPAGMHKDFEKTFGVPMIETMGLTETAATVLSNPMPPGERKPGSVGIPFGNEAKIIDDEMREMEPGRVGEIVLRGDNVFTHYHNAPEITAESFTTDGWFRTGDLGYRDEDGYFFVTGRQKELIIKGGENIAPREIDDVLYHHDAVLEVGAFGMPDETYGQVVAIGVVLKPDQDCAEEELMQYCRDNLGQFRTPSAIYFLDSLPKGPSGKIQRLELAKMFEE